MVHQTVQYTSDVAVVAGVDTVVVFVVVAVVVVVRGTVVVVFMTVVVPEDSNVYLMLLSI